MSTLNLRNTPSKTMTATTSTARKPSIIIHHKPTKRQKDQNEYFTTYAFVIFGLLPLIPRDEREMVERWMEKLQTLNKNDEERHIRNDYIWLLLVQLESGAVTLPFIQPPPEGRLGPVAKSVDKAVYEEILQAANKRLSNIEDAEIIKQGERRDSDVERAADGETMFKIKPENFLEKQPIPKYGFIVYGSCFSDQSDLKYRSPV